AALIEAHKDRPGPLLPLLHDVQDALGCIPGDVVAQIARGLNLSRADVHGVITYYHDFRSEPAGRHVVQICRAEACRACGSEELVADAERIFSCRIGHTSVDGAVTLESVYCLGLCASSPAMQVDDRLHALVTPERLQRIADALGTAQ